MSLQMDDDDRLPDSYYRDLYQQFCNGKRDAQHELYNLCAGRLLRYVRRSCVFQDFDAAEDCVQNTWQRLFELCATNPLKATGNFWGWVCAIALSQAVDKHRSDTRQKRRPEAGFVSLNDEDNPLDVADTAADPARLYEQSEEHQQAMEQQRLFQEAVAALPEKQRVAFNLWALGRYSLDDMATMLHENPETVKTRIRFAKNKLKQALAAFEPQLAH